MVLFKLMINNWSLNVKCFGILAWLNFHALIQPYFQVNNFTIKR